MRRTDVVHSRSRPTGPAQHERGERSRLVTHSLGELNHPGHVVAESSRRDLSEDVEERVAVGIDEVVSARLGVVTDNDVRARVLDLVDLGGLESVDGIDLRTHAGLASGAGNGVGVDLRLRRLVGDERARAERTTGDAGRAHDAEGGDRSAHHLEVDTARDNGR